MLSPRAELTLYISTPAASSFRALQTLGYILACYGHAQIRLKVWDLSQELPGVHDRITLTPLLVIRTPTACHTLGDLSDPGPLARQLRALGLEPLRQFDSPEQLFFEP
jgi:hypothetical protein